MSTTPASPTTTPSTTKSLTLKEYFNKYKYPLIITGIIILVCCSVIVISTIKKE